MSIGAACLAGALLFAVAAYAQKQQNVTAVSEPERAYQITRETVLQGTVVKYTEASTVAPLGPHATIQTSAGVVDVHLGNARLLQANHLSLASGDTVRIVGENVVVGTNTQFVARLIQKGSQVVTLRSTRGFPLSPAVKFGPRSEAGAL
jgi:hypothetical protein